MPTIYDVAKLAQVSAMTVSRTLNTPEKVRPESRAKIEAAIAELGYRQNQAARALVLQSTGIVKLQMSAGLRGNHLYFSQLFSGITDVLSQHKLAMLVTDHHEHTAACDGKIIMGLTRDAQMALTPSKTPKVLFGKGPDCIDWIDVDNERGCRRATERMLSLGHERVGFFTFPSTEPFIKEREAGYRRAMQEAGITVQPNWIVTAMNNSVEAGYSSGRALLNQRAVTAVVCCSDHVAVGLAQAAYDSHVSVPEELSIIGFDGVGQERMGKPILATMRQPVFDIGRWLAKTLVQRIKQVGDAAPQHQMVTPDILLNDSTAPLKAVLWRSA